MFCILTADLVDHVKKLIKAFCSYAITQSKRIYSRRSKKHFIIQHCISCIILCYYDYLGNRIFDASFLRNSYFVLYNAIHSNNYLKSEQSCALFFYSTLTKLKLPQKDGLLKHSTI